ncbi:4'-phosphopantetheinyl transferase family protein [Streptomyces altiplanensis]
MSTADISIWTVRSERGTASPEEEYAVLDAAERERMSRLRRERDRARYRTVHHAFRVIVGQRLGIAPQEVGFRRHCAHCDEDGHGKPVPHGPDGTVLSASLSHSGRYALIAVCDSPQVPVGVDIERIRPHMDWTAIPCVSGGRRTHGFEQWTRAEALVKAAGTGLSRTPPRYTGQSFGSWRAARVPGSEREWFVRSVRSPDGYAASVAGSSPEARVSVADWRGTAQAGLVRR